MGQMLPTVWHCWNFGLISSSAPGSFLLGSMFIATPSSSSSVLGTGVSQSLLSPALLFSGADMADRVTEGIGAPEVMRGRGQPRAPHGDYSGKGRGEFQANSVNI